MLQIFALLVLLTNLLAFVSGTAEAQNWPTRPIKFVVPYGPGIGLDIMARMIADRLSRRLGHAVIVENQPGLVARLAHIRGEGGARRIHVPIHRKQSSHLKHLPIQVVA